MVLGLSACSSKSDQELNKKFSTYNRENIYYSQDSKYYWYYEQKFENLPIDTVLLSMGLDWFVDQYDEVYMGKADYFYVPAFDTPNVSTYDLVNMYNNDIDNLNYLKPFIDCYLLMNKNSKPSKDELETIKETILYALDYYIGGKDFAGTLE